jgi:hypothetical protein
MCSTSKQHVRSSNWCLVSSSLNSWQSSVVRELKEASQYLPMPLNRFYPIYTIKTSFLKIHLYPCLLSPPPPKHFLLPQACYIFCSSKLLHFINKNTQRSSLCNLPHYFYTDILKTLFSSIPQQCSSLRKRQFYIHIKQGKNNNTASFL